MQPEKKERNTWHMIDEFINEVSEVLKNPDKELWFEVLVTAINDYTCGVFNNEVVGYNPQRHQDAYRYIFGPQYGFNCFDEIWSLFFPNIEVEYVKRKLREKFEHKKNGATNAINTNIGGRRGSKVGNNIRHTRDLGISIEEFWSEFKFLGTNCNQLREPIGVEELQDKVYEGENWINSWLEEIFK